MADATENQKITEDTQNQQQQEQDQPQVPEVVLNQVFVGNLDFKTTEDDLMNHFSETGIAIKNVQIIKRGSRPIGYGFVEFETKEAAENAVQSKNNTPLLERNINVELVKPNHNSENRRGRGTFSRGRGRGGPRRGRGGFRNRTAQDQAAPEEEKAAAASSPEASATTGADTVTNPTSPETVGAAEHAEEGKEESNGRFRRGRGRGRGFRARGRGRGFGVTGPRRAGTPTGEPSKTTLFVSNIPFEYDDEKLKGIFTDFSVVSAKVITRKFGYFKFKSKGFGFVEFANEEDQQKALAFAQEVKINDRQLNVKVAVDSDNYKASQEDGAANQAEAAAPESSAAATA